MKYKTTVSRKPEQDYRIKRFSYSLGSFLTAAPKSYLHWTSARIGQWIRETGKKIEK